MLRGGGGEEEEKEASGRRKGGESESAPERGDQPREPSDTAVANGWDSMSQTAIIKCSRESSGFTSVKT